MKENQQIKIGIEQIILIILMIQLYIDYISQPSRAVLAFCIISNIPVKIHEVRIAKLQHLSQEYSSINPMRKVPAIYDSQNQMRLGESHAIMEYLTQKFKLTQKWYLKDDKIHAKINEYLHYHHANTRKCAMLLYVQLFGKLYPVQHKTMLDNKVLREELSEILNFIEENYFKDSHFMIGTVLTVADLAAYFQFQSLALLQFDFSKWKKVREWMKALQSLQGVAKSNQKFIKMIPKMKKLLPSL